jgi:hypothetical protein
VTWSRALSHWNMRWWRLDEWQDNGPQDLVRVSLCIITLKHEVMAVGWMARQWASGSRQGMSVHSNCNR